MIGLTKHNRNIINRAVYSFSYFVQPPRASLLTLSSHQSLAFFVYRQAYRKDALGTKASKMGALDSLVQEDRHVWSISCHEANSPQIEGSRNFYQSKQHVFIVI